MERGSGQRARSLGAAALIAMALTAIDTNIILRFLTRQPKAQFDAARALEAVLQLPGVTVQNAEEVFAAVGFAKQGMPFKDACVLAFSSGASRLVTFDKPFAKRAAKLGLRPEVFIP